MEISRQMEDKWPHVNYVVDVPGVVSILCHFQSNGLVVPA